MDPLLAHTTQEAALAQTGYQGNTEPLCNYFFMSASTVVIIAIVYWLTQKWLLPALGKLSGKKSNNKVNTQKFHRLGKPFNHIIVGTITTGTEPVSHSRDARP